MNRRRFLKLLGAIFPALSLRLPMDEIEPIEEEYTEEIIITDTLDNHTRDHIIDSYAKPCRDTHGPWWGYDTDGRLWISHDFGNTWQELTRG
ncbi:MAG: hypothetical protein PVJ86_02810 [Phycisphaerales bacterium]|jgi:hypothetical protein